MGTRIVFLTLMTLFVSISALSEPDVGIGQEEILPLRYPKFSLGSNYLMNRRFHGFADPILRYRMDERFSGIMSFETGLYKYFNAGALLSANFSKLTSGEPLFMSFALFAKPYFPITKRLAIFARIGAGLGWGAGFMYFKLLPYLKSSLGGFAKANIERVFKEQQYSSDLYGVTGLATAGVEFFPFSRIGLALEWGIWTSLMHASRNIPFMKPVENKPGAPSSLNVMIYELPIGLTLHVIL